MPSIGAPPIVMALMYCIVAILHSAISFPIRTLTDTPRFDGGVVTITVIGLNGHPYIHLPISQALPTVSDGIDSDLDEIPIQHDIWNFTAVPLQVDEPISILDLRILAFAPLPSPNTDSTPFANDIPSLYHLRVSFHHTRLASSLLSEYLTTVTFIDPEIVTKSPLDQINSFQFAATINISLPPFKTPGNFFITFELVNSITLTPSTTHFQSQFHLHTHESIIESSGSSQTSRLPLISPVTQSSSTCPSGFIGPMCLCKVAYGVFTFNFDNLFMALQSELLLLTLAHQLNSSKLQSAESVSDHNFFIIDSHRRIIGGDLQHWLTEYFSEAIAKDLGLPPSRVAIAEVTLINFSLRFVLELKSLYCSENMLDSDKTPPLSSLSPIINNTSITDLRELWDVFLTNLANNRTTAITDALSFVLMTSPLLSYIYQTQLTSIPSLVDLIPFTFSSTINPDGSTSTVVRTGKLTTSLSQRKTQALSYSDLPPVNTLLLNTVCTTTSPLASAGISDPTCPKSTESCIGNLDFPMIFTVPMNSEEEASSPSNDNTLRVTLLSTIFGAAAGVIVIVGSFIAFKIYKKRKIKQNIQNHNVKISSDKEKQANCGDQYRSDSIIAYPPSFDTQHHSIFSSTLSRLSGSEDRIEHGQQIDPKILHTNILPENPAPDHLSINISLLKVPTLDASVPLPHNPQKHSSERSSTPPRPTIRSNSPRRCGPSVTNPISYGFPITVAPLTALRPFKSPPVPCGRPVPHNATFTPPPSHRVDEIGPRQYQAIQQQKRNRAEWQSTANITPYTIGVLPYDTWRPRNFYTTNSVCLCDRCTYLYFLNLMEMGAWVPEHAFPDTIPPLTHICRSFKNRQVMVPIHETSIEAETAEDSDTLVTEAKQAVVQKFYFAEYYRMLAGDQKPPRCRKNIRSLWNFNEIQHQKYLSRLPLPPLASQPIPLPQSYFL